MYSMHAPLLPGLCRRHVSAGRLACISDKARIGEERTVFGSLLPLAMSSSGQRATSYCRRPVAIFLQTASDLDLAKPTMTKLPSSALLVKEQLD